MKVVCYNLSFNDTYTDDITPGKIYEVVFKSDFFPLIYTLKNDVGIITQYNSKLFLTIEEWREKQLQKIGII